MLLTVRKSDGLVDTWTALAPVIDCTGYKNSITGLSSLDKWKYVGNAEFLVYIDV